MGTAKRGLKTSANYTLAKAVEDWAAEAMDAASIRENERRARLVGDQRNAGYWAG